MPRKTKILTLDQHQHAAECFGRADIAIAEIERLVYPTYFKASAQVRKLLVLRKRFAEARVALEDALCKENPEMTLADLNCYTLSRETTAQPEQRCVGCAVRLTVRTDGFCESCVRLPALAL